MQVQDIRTTRIARAAFVVGIALLLGIAAVFTLVVLADQEPTIGGELGQSAEAQEPIDSSLDMQFLGPGSTGAEVASSSYAVTAHAPFEEQLSAWSSALTVNSRMAPVSAHATFDMQFLGSGITGSDLTSSSYAVTAHAPFEEQLRAWSSALTGDSTMAPAPAHATFDMQLLQTIGTPPQE